MEHKQTTKVFRKNFSHTVADSIKKPSNMNSSTNTTSVYKFVLLGVHFDQKEEQGCINSRKKILCYSPFKST
jgi:hypothetical protein